MNESLAQRIKRLRKEAGLSQAQLADACGWKSQSRVVIYEAGTREPTWADISAIAKALRIDDAQLLLVKHTPQPTLALSALRTAQTSVAQAAPPMQSGQCLPRAGKNVPGGFEAENYCGSGYCRQQRRHGGLPAQAKSVTRYGLPITTSAQRWVAGRSARIPGNAPGHKGQSQASALPWASPSKSTSTSR